MDRISRRRFVVAVAGALATGGCLDAGGDPPSTDATTESMGTSTATPTATPESTSMATPTAETKRRDTLFIENVDQEEHTVEVEMTEQSPETNEPIVSGTYSVPGRTGVVFGGVGAEGSTYSLRVNFAQSGWEEHTWEVGACSKEIYPAGGNRNARITIEDGSYRFAVPGCDVHGRYEFEYVQPEEVDGRGTGRPTTSPPSS